MIRNINVFVIVLHVCFNSADSGNPFRNQIDRSINALMLLISSVCATGFLISALVGNLLWFSWAPLRLPYYVNLISRRIVHVLISVPCP